MAHEENLTGFVQGIKASTLEERFARALEKANKKYIFAFKVLPPTQIPGQENEVDFMVEGAWPIEIDGTFVHKSASQREADKLRDAVLDEYLGQKGYYPIIRIGGHMLETQANADKLVGDLI